MSSNFNACIFLDETMLIKLDVVVFSPDVWQRLLHAVGSKRALGLNPHHRHPTTDTNLVSVFTASL